MAFHGRLSEDTVYARFFSSKPTLSAAEVERFTHVDHDDRVALVAELGDRLVAVARYDRTAAPHPTSAGSGEQIADRRDEVAVPWAAGERHDRTRELVLMPMSTVRGIR